MSVLRSIGVPFFGNSSLRLAGVSLAVLAATSVARGGISYVLTDLSNPLGVPGGVGRAINNSGQVLGWVAVPGNSSASIHAFLYSGGTYQELGTLPGYRDANPTAMNSSGQVVGYAGNGTGQGEPFFYSNGSMRDLGLSYGYATGINDNGQVTGDLSSTTGAFTSKAYLYDNGVVTHLGVTGFANSYAQGINDRGQVVGWLTKADGSGFGGFLYSDGATYNLNDLLVDAPGYSITDAFGINDSGQIIAEANIPSKFPIDDAVLLTPISTPTAIALPPAAWAALSTIPLLVFGKRIRRAIR